LQRGTESATHQHRTSAVKLGKGGRKREKERDKKLGWHRCDRRKTKQ